VFEDAVYAFDDMYKDKYALTALAQEHLATHDWKYPNGQEALRAVTPGETRGA
jgi:hypothetical protein